MLYLIMTAERGFAALVPSTKVTVPSRSDTDVEILISAPSSKEAPSFGDVIDTDGAEFPVSDTITNTSSNAL